MAKDYDGWNIFHCIYNTKLNHDDSVKDVYDTYIIFVVNKYKYGKIKNAYKKHAELTLIEKLSSLYPHNRPMHVDVYMNNSPCRDCALELLEFLEASRQTQITVYFANLYNIRRKSCIISMEKHVKKVEKNDDDQNSEGLRRLMDHKRCKLLPFNLPAWTELYDIFGVQDPEFELNVDYTLMKAGKDRSREKEDLLLLEDLDYIYLQEICKHDDVRVY
ncbi:uncharacterized protein LOC134246714 [Saccostrea cucullata]|uniref:uncharacterized protein LOC134246714 n=1 Tax=Saccostrea cuccullata TaxID=36930 RepID=UPI002ED04F8E